MHNDVVVYAVACSPCKTPQPTNQTNQAPTHLTGPNKQLERLHRTRRPFSLLRCLSMGAAAVFFFFLLRHCHAMPSFFSQQQTGYSNIGARIRDNVHVVVDPHTHAHMHALPLSPLSLFRFFPKSHTHDASNEDPSRKAAITEPWYYC